MQAQLGSCRREGPCSRAYESARFEAFDQAVGNRERPDMRGGHESCSPFRTEPPRGDEVRSEPTTFACMSSRLVVYICHGSQPYDPASSTIRGRRGCGWSGGPSALPSCKEAIESQGKTARLVTGQILRGHGTSYDVRAETEKHMSSKPLAGIAIHCR